MRYDLGTRWITDSKCYRIGTRCRIGMKTIEQCGIRAPIAIVPGAGGMRRAGIGKCNIGIETGRIGIGEFGTNGIYDHRTQHYGVFTAVGICNYKRWTISTNRCIHMRHRRTRTGTKIAKCPCAGKRRYTRTGTGKCNRARRVADGKRRPGEIGNGWIINVYVRGFYQRGHTACGIGHKQGNGIVTGCTIDMRRCSTGARWRTIAPVPGVGHGAGNTARTGAGEIDRGAWANSRIIGIETYYRRRINGNCHRICAHCSSIGSSKCYYVCTRSSETGRRIR